MDVGVPPGGNAPWAVRRPFPRLDHIVNGGPFIRGLRAAALNAAADLGGRCEGGVPHARSTRRLSQTSLLWHRFSSSDECVSGVYFSPLHTETLHPIWTTPSCSSSLFSSHDSGVVRPSVQLVTAYGSPPAGCELRVRGLWTITPFASVKGVLTYILFELIRSYLYQSPAKRTHEII